MNVTCYSRAEFAAMIALLVSHEIGCRATATSDGTYIIELTGAY